MGLFDGNTMRGMSNASYEDIRLSKRRELNDSMSIDYNKSEDEYGQQVHSLSKTSFTDDNSEEV